MKFNLKRPCDNCPFRREGAIELRPGRIEQIVDDLLRDDRNWFICHKTIGHEPGQCVGAMAYLLKVGSPSVSMRLAAAFGMLDYEALRAQAHHIIEPLERHQ